MIPDKSVVAAAPKVIVWAPIKTDGFANLTFVTPASVNCVVPIDWLIILKDTLLFETVVLIWELPSKSKVSFVLNVSVPVSPVIVKLE